MTAVTETELEALHDELDPTAILASVDAIDRLRSELADTVDGPPANAWFFEVP